MSRLGIFGGSFNPPHMGHLVICEIAREYLSLERVLFVPSKNPPHKNPTELAPAEIRLIMTKRAIEGNRYFQLSTVEFEEGQEPYTVNTLERIKQDFPGSELYLIIGGDSLTEIESWHNWKRLWELAHIVAAKRTGDKYPENLPGEVIFIPTPYIDISSTEIRERIKAGKSIRYLVPNGVMEIIEKYGLYR